MKSIVIFLLACAALWSVYFIDFEYKCYWRGHASEYDAGLQYDFKSCSISAKYKFNERTVRFEDEWTLE